MQTAPHGQQTSVEGKLSLQDLEDFVENALEGLHSVGPDGTILWANQAELDLLGYGREEYVGRKIQEFHADATVIEYMLAQLSQGKPLRNHPARLLAKDGSIRHVLVTSNGRLEGDRLLHTRCFTRDITDQVETGRDRQRVISAEAGKASAAEPVAEGYLHLGPDWRITFASIGGGRESRRERPELVGRTVWEAFPGVAGTEFADKYEQAMRTRQPVTFVAYFAQTDTWMENRLFPAGDGLALYYADVTSQHRLQQQLQARNLQQATIARLGLRAVEGPPIDAFLAEVVEETARTLNVDLAKVLQLLPDGQRLLLRAGVGWNPGLVGVGTVSAGLESQAGYTLESATPVIVEDFRTETRFRGPTLLHDHGVVSGMSVIIHGKQGPWGVFGVHTRSRHQFTPDDVNFLQAVANLVATAAERTAAEAKLARHRADLEAEVQQRTAQLQAANRELEAFSYTVSHDLRSPLRTLDGFSKILLHKHSAGLAPEAQELLRMLSEGANRMGSLIESVLALSRIGRAQLDRKAVDLSSLSRGILDALSHETKRQVHVEVQPGMVVDADPGMMRIVLQNLLGNAWKFTARTTTPSVQVTAARQGADLAVCIRDNGAGFDMAHVEELFQPFHRLHAAGEFEGTGIGLATVRRIIERHGGQVWAEGQVGGGASFCFSLPAPAEAGRP